MTLNFFAEAIEALGHSVLVLERLALIVLLLDLLLLNLGLLGLTLTARDHRILDLLDDLLALLLSRSRNVLGRHATLPVQELTIFKPVVLVSCIWVQVVKVHLLNAGPGLLLLSLAHDLHVLAESAADAHSFSHLLLQVPVLKDLWIVITDLSRCQHA